MTRLQHLLCGAAALAAWGSGASAFAQDAADGSRLDEVVVTAQRSTERLQDVPIAVSALSSVQLEERQIVTTNDLGRSVPNLVASNNVGLSTASAFFLRGVGQDESIATSDPAVGTYVDGVYISRQVANNAYLYDIERIEVLRGPQGTLYGRNTSGGAVSIITRKPGADVRGVLEGSYGNYGRYDLKASLSGPLSSTLFGGVSAFVAKQDEGFQQNITTRGEGFNRDSQGVRAALRWTPTESFEVNLSADTVSEKPLAVLPIAVGPGGATRDLFVARTGYPSHKQDVKQQSVTLQASWTQDWGVVQSITGWRKLDQKFDLDLSDNPRPLATLLTDATFKQFSQELSVTGQAFDKKLSWVVGAFYMTEDNESFIEDDYRGLGLFIFDKVLKNESDSYAVYGQATYRPVEAIGITLGGRWTHEKKTVDVRQTAQIPGLGNVPLFNTADVRKLGTPTAPVFEDFNPKIAIDYRIQPGVTAYVSYTEGFKSGGWNGRALSAAEFVDVKAENVKSYEAGLKSEWFDRRLRINARLFLRRLRQLHRHRGEPPDWRLHHHQRGRGGDPGLRRRDERAADAGPGRLRLRRPDVQRIQVPRPQRPVPQDERDQAHPGMDGPGRLLL